MPEAAEHADVLAVDTDAFSWAFFDGQQKPGWVELLQGHVLALPFAVVGELKVAAKRGRWGARRGAVLDQKIGGCVVLPADARVVEQWAAMSARLAGHLKQGGTNDLWIAACCVVHGLPLATGNTSDFGTIAGEFPQLRLVHP